MKGFVAKIGKTGERPEENAETDAMAIKVRIEIVLFEEMIQYFIFICVFP